MSKIQQEIEKLANEYADKHGFRVPYDGSNKFYNDDDVKWSKEGFIAGYKSALQSEERIKVLESKVDKLTGLHTVFGPLPADEKDLAEIEHYFKSLPENKVSDEEDDLWDAVMHYRKDHPEKDNDVSAEENFNEVGSIKKCPFCNGEPYEGGTKDGRFVIKCYSCGVEMIQDRKDKVRGIWNNREYASLVNERKQLDTDKLSELDQILVSFEDWMHDDDGKKITKARGIIIELQKGERKDNVGVNDAIAFAEWLLKNNMSANGFGGWGGGKINVNFYGSKTTDLYKHFQESQPQQKEADEEKLLEELKSECKRIKIQRNNYEQELIQARKKISKLQSELDLITHK